MEQSIAMPFPPNGTHSCGEWVGPALRKKRWVLGRQSTLRGPGIILAQAFALLAGVLAGARSSFAADPASGGALAQQWCISCHVLPGNPHQSAPQGPPSFRDIARDKTPDQLRVFLIRPHGAMPQLSLSRSEIDDVVAYIETLRRFPDK
jgi:cytochrome c